MKKDRKKRHQELLGMSMSTADKKLRKAIILEMARQLGKNVCLECGRPIEEPDDLAVKHVEDWEGDPDQFFDLTNIAFGHVTCGAGGHGKRQEEESEMIVEVSVEDANGNRLPGVRHQGDIYVAGKRDKRYQVRVRNRTGARVLVVTTVDGRNVNTGEPGDHTGPGHVLGPHQSWVFTGWRTSDDRVAAFRLGSKGDAYSSQMGSSENVGVIGVAVFEERQPDPRIITVKEREYVPYPVPVPVPTRPWAWPHTWIGGYVHPTTTSDTLFVGSSGISATSDNCELNSSSFTVSSSTVPVSRELNSTSSNPAGSRSLRKRSRRKSRERQELGTEFGEQLVSSVVSCEFVRQSDEPCEVHAIRYDSRDALKRRGIRVDRPSRKPEDAPSPFPRNEGYCQPPPRRRAYKGR